MTLTTSKRRLAWILLISAIGLLWVGCTARIADLTLVSTKNIDLTNTQLDAKTGQRITADDCGYIILGIPFRWPNLKEAVDRALEKGKGNVMVDEVTEVKETWIVVGRQVCYVVEGTVLTAPQTGSAKTSKGLIE